MIAPARRPERVTGEIVQFYAVGKQWYVPYHSEAFDSLDEAVGHAWAGIEWGQYHISHIETDDGQIVLDGEALGKAMYAWEDRTFR